MGLVLRKNLGTPDQLQAGEWCYHEGAVHLACPLCGKAIELDERHALARDGRITPALRCPSCPLIEWVHLGGYGDP